MIPWRRVSWNMGHNGRSHHHPTSAPCLQLRASYVHARLRRLAAAENQDCIHTKTKKWPIPMARTQKLRGNYSNIQDTEYIDKDIRLARLPSSDSSSSSSSSFSPSNSPKEVRELVYKRPRVSLPLYESPLNIAKERFECPDWEYALLLEELGYYGLINTAYHKCITAQQEHAFATYNTFCHLYK